MKKNFLERKNTFIYHTLNHPLLLLGLVTDLVIQAIGMLEFEDGLMTITLWWGSALCIVDFQGPEQTNKQTFILIWSLVMLLDIHIHLWYP